MVNKSSPTHSIISFKIRRKCAWNTVLLKAPPVFLSSNTNYIMKKILILFVSLFLAVTTFAVPDWDKPLHRIKITKAAPSFDPPIYVDFQMSVVSGGSHPNLKIYFELDHTVNYTVHAVISIWGWWYDVSAGWYEGMKSFNWSIAPGLLWNTQYDFMWPGEVPNLDWYTIDSFA